ncbi:MAG: hypothetical protein ACLQVA_08470 [Candidatus Brocadiia bacterium]
MDELIAVQLYPDFSTFCSTAIENQLLLEESATGDTLHPAGTEPTAGMAKTGPKTRGNVKDGAHRSGNAMTSLTLSRAPSHGQEKDIRSPVKGQVDRHQLQQPLSDLAIDRVSKSPPFGLPSAVPDIFDTTHVVPVDRWFFGQYNRLLPAKVSLRALAVVSQEGREALVLDNIAPRVAELAAGVGDYLRALDQRHTRHRDDALATAFPTAGAEGEKGRVRYQYHFVGHTARGEQGGMLVALKFATVQVIKNKPHILPTSAGWEFALIANPILDGDPTAETPTLSAEEIAFLLRHIKEHVPVEFFACRVLLSLIDEGKVTPTAVTQCLARYLVDGKTQATEEDFLSTQKNGVLGRLGDLRLVQRLRKGTSITYRLTSEGKAFLEENKLQEANVQIPH